MEEYENEFDTNEIIEDEETTADDEYLPVGDDTQAEAVNDAEVIGVRFKTSGKTYYFDPAGSTYTAGSYAIVETARGLEYGYVSMGNTVVPGSDIVPPLRRAVRTATDEDRDHREENERLSREAFDICAEQIDKHRLGMKLIDAEYTFDNTKLLFYFSADGRVDFRELVKDLASIFHTRIELRQVGIRDEAKMIGGFGVCGRPFCCATFLPDFVQVSIKMAKEQNLSLNSSKISGACGRLMCCLRYEHEVYEEAIKKMPRPGMSVSTPEGDATVIEIQPLAALVKVRMNDDPTQVKIVPLEDTGAPGVRIQRTARVKKSEPSDDAAEQKETRERPDDTGSQSSPKSDDGASRRRGTRGRRRDRGRRGRGADKKSEE